MERALIINQNGSIKSISEKEIDIASYIQRSIFNTMDSKHWYAPLRWAEFLTPIKGTDGTYLLVYQGEIIGLFVLTCNIPDVLSEYKLPSSNYMLIDSVMIKEGYRGHGLQRQILKFVYDRAIDLKMNGLVSTVHPDNKYSLNNFILEDYKILHKLIIHGGIRNVMIKSIDNI